MGVVSSGGGGDGGSYQKRLESNRRPCSRSQSKDVTDTELQGAWPPAHLVALCVCECELRVHGWRVCWV